MKNTFTHVPEKINTLLKTKNIFFKDTCKKSFSSQITKINYFNYEALFN